MPEDRTVTSQREREAVELLDRIYGRQADHQLSGSGMFEEWVDDQVMAFIRKYGSFKDQLREMDRG